MRPDTVLSLIIPFIEIYAAVLCETCCVATSLSLCPVALNPRFSGDIYPLLRGNRSGRVVVLTRRY